MFRSIRRWLGIGDYARPQSDRARAALWRRISSFEIDEPNVSMPFSSRLAEENTWSLDSANAAIVEYLKFCFLAVVSEREVTPSEVVDKIWHLHLSYTHSYWERFCGQTLNYALHHNPTKGGRAEDSRFAAQYAHTIALYLHYFGEPPVEFWPGSESVSRPKRAKADASRSASRVTATESISYYASSSDPIYVWPNADNGGSILHQSASTHSSAHHSHFADHFGDHSHGVDAGHAHADGAAGCGGGGDGGGDGGGGGASCGGASCGGASCGGGGGCGGGGCGG